MSVKQSLNYISNMRVDLPHLRSVDSSVVFDFKSLLESFVSDTPYILNGFTVSNAPGAINGIASNIQIVVSDSSVWMPGDPNGPFLDVPTGTPNEVLNSANSKVTGSFTAGAINYLSIVFSRAPDPTTSDLVAAWDVDAGVEFTKTVPLGNVLNYQFVVSTTGFGTAAPIAIITTDASNNVLSIENAKQGLFRLGSGGTSPDPNNSYTLSLTPENPLIVSSSGGSDPFAGGDWQLANWKNWMDLVMTQFKNVFGSAYWYLPGSSLIPGINLSDMYFDAIASKMTGAGAFLHSNATPGLLSWSSNLNIRSIFGKLTLVVTAGNVTLNDGDVAYINIVRNNAFQPSNTFTFTNGSVTVNASATISGISSGDWIKATADNMLAWAQVLSVSGTSITLVSAYQGTNSVGPAVKTVGTYTMQSASPSSLPLNANTYWIAKRDDNSFTPLTIASSGSSGATRTLDVSTIKTTAAHGLVLGQTVSITGVSDSTFDGTFVITSVPLSTTFTYNNSGDDVGATMAGGGSVSSVPKIYLRLSNGNTELEQGEDIPIDDNTTLNILNYIGSPSEGASSPVYASTKVVTQGISLTGAISQLDAVLGAPSYGELLTVVSGSPGFHQINPVSAGTNITIPTNTRLAGSPQQFYIVGKGSLEVYLNGQYLALGVEWAEVGSAGSPSDQIQINTLDGLVVGDIVEFRLIVGGASGGGGGGGSASLQTAYGNGSTITTSSGNPVTITSGGGKAAQFNGDIGVTGVIDPAGLELDPQSSNPLAATKPGIWADLSGNLMATNGSSNINITQTISSNTVNTVNGSSGAINLNAGSNITITPTGGGNFTIASTGGGSSIVLTRNLTNNTGSTIPANSAVYVSAPGQISLASCTNVTPAAARAIGITTASILNGASGPVAYAGCALGVFSGLTNGNYAYLTATPGVLSDTPPSTVGYELVSLGVIEGNNLFIQIQNFGSI